MLEKDGRVISNFIFQSLKSKPLTIFGNGLQTRSFCYVDDLISGIIKVMNGSLCGPINLGNNEEIKIIDLAKRVKTKINSNLEFVFKKPSEDDPLRRKPSIELARKAYDWYPKVCLDLGLDYTIEYFKKYTISGA